MEVSNLDEDDPKKNENFNFWLKSLGNYKKSLWNYLINLENIRISLGKKKHETYFDECVLKVFLSDPHFKCY